MPFPADDVVSALRDAAAALAPALPSETGLQPGPAGAGTDGPTVDVLGPGSRAIVARLQGALDARLVIALPAAAAEVLEQGPRGPLDLGEVVGPWLSAAAQALSGALGSDLSVLSVETMDAPVAWAGAPNADRASVALVAEGTPGAVCAVLLPPGTLAVAPTAPAPDAIAAAEEATFTPLQATAPTGNGEGHPLEILNDVELGVTAELGRTQMTVRELLSLAPGSIVELDRPAGSNLDLYVNGTLIARGEVVVIDDEFGIRISEVVGRNPAVSGGN